MADGQPTERARDRLIPRVEGMDQEERIKRHSKAIAWLEAIWHVEAAEATSDVDRMIAESFLDRFVRIHKDADIAAFDRRDVPMPRNGSR